MAQQTATLLVGAGAEMGGPIGLPAGKSITLETCYHNNRDLYKALRRFYEGRLGKAVMD